MSEYKNPEHFNISGDNIVTLTVRFDQSTEGDDKVAMRNAAYYLNMLANSNEHTAWGRDISVTRKSKD